MTETTREKAIRVMAEAIKGPANTQAATDMFDAILEHVGPVMPEIQWGKGYVPEKFLDLQTDVNIFRHQLLDEQKAKIWS